MEMIRIAVNLGKQLQKQIELKDKISNKWSAMRVEIKLTVE